MKVEEFRKQQVLRFWSVSVSGPASRLHLFNPQQVQRSQGSSLSAVNSVNSQKVQNNGQQHHQGTGEEEIVIVDKGEMEPAAMGLPDTSLPKVPEWQESGFI